MTPNDVCEYIARHLLIHPSTQEVLQSNREMPVCNARACWTLDPAASSTAATGTAILPLIAIVGVAWAAALFLAPRARK